jgi:hypothetical protein
MAALERSLPRPAALALAVAVALSACTLAAARASAASAWVTSPEPVAASIPLQSAPVVGMDEAGNATELWLQGEGKGVAIESSTRQAGGAWTPAVAVPSEGHAAEPVLAVSSAGQATAAWVDYREGESPQVWSSQRTPGGAWSAALPLGGAVPQRGVHGLSVDLDAGGDGVVAWYEYSEGGGEQWLEVDVRQGTSWRGPERISQEAGVRGYEHPALATDGHGGFIAIWAEANDLDTVFSITADELREGVWQGDQTLMSGSESLGPPNIAENAAGEATALWMNYQLRDLDTASLRGGQWNVQLVEGGTTENECYIPQPQVGIDAAGDSTAAWVNNSDNVLSGTLPSGGAWTGISQLTEFPEGTVAQALSLREDPAGDAALVWNRLDYYEYALGVEATYRTAGQTWEMPAGISTETFNSEPSLAMDARGDALASWGASQGESYDELSYAYVEAPPTSAPSSNESAPADASGSSESAPANASGSSSVPSNVRASTGSPGLAPVYLVVPHSRLHLHRGSRTLTASIRNRNAFTVTGTATISWFLLPRRGAHAASSHATPTAIATIAHFSLPADASGQVRFRLSTRALRRLFAYVPDSGHDLVSIRLLVQGADGQHSSGATVYALDAPITARVRHRHAPVVPPGYRAPVDPWVKAHAAC